MLGGPWWASGAGHCPGAAGHHPRALGLAWPGRSTPLLTHHWDQESCPCLGLLSPPSSLAVPMALPWLWHPQHCQWAGDRRVPSCCPPRLQCSPPELPAGTRGSIPPEKPQESHVGKSPGCQGCSPRAVPEAFVLPLQPRGRNRVIPSPEGMGSPSLRPARARGTTGLSL